MLAPVIIVGGLVFVPLLVIALVMLPPVRALVLATTFTLGALSGFFLGLLAGGRIFGHHQGDSAGMLYLYAFASLAAIAGGLLCVFLLGKLGGRSLWRRP